MSSPPDGAEKLFPQLLQVMLCACSGAALRVPQAGHGYCFVDESLDELMSTPPLFLSAIVTVYAKHSNFNHRV